MGDRRRGVLRDFRVACAIPVGGRGGSGDRRHRGVYGADTFGTARGAP